jgi:orotate phosphoribosyltransferase
LVSWVAYDVPPLASGWSMESEYTRKLLELLAKYAYAYKPGGFKLASGAVSDEYLDCKQALSHADALPALGNVFLARLDQRVTAVGGLTMGADPIAISTAFVSAGMPTAVQWFSVRKERKEHGRKRLIEGSVSDGAVVAVVDDVVTTGGSTIEAINKCREAGLMVVQVLVLVDRQQGGLERVREVAGPAVPVVAMYTKGEVRSEWEAQQARASRLSA